MNSCGISVYKNGASLSTCPLKSHHCFSFHRTRPVLLASAMWLGSSTFWSVVWVWPCWWRWWSFATSREQSPAEWSNPSTTPCAAPPWPGWAGTAAGGRTGGSSHMTSPKLCRRCRAWATRPAWAWEPLACDRLDRAPRVTCNAWTSRSPAVCPHVCLPATDAQYCQNALYKTS